MLQVLGAAWYLLSLDRYTTCWKSFCKKEHSPRNCFLYLDCSSLNIEPRKIWANSTNVFNSCDPSNDDIEFKYGIFENAVKKHVVSSNFIPKYLYCLWWGLQQLRYDLVVPFVSTEFWFYKWHIWLIYVKVHFLIYFILRIWCLLTNEIIGFKVGK